MAMVLLVHCALVLQYLTSRNNKIHDQDATHTSSCLRELSTQRAFIATTISYCDLQWMLMSKTIIIILIFCHGKPAMSTSKSAQRHTAPSMRTLQLSPQMPSANALPHPGSSRRRDGSSSTPQAAARGPACLLAHALPEVLQLRPYHLPGSRCELVAEFVEVTPQTFSLGAFLLLRFSLLLFRLPWRSLQHACPSRCHALAPAPPALWRPDVPPSPHGEQLAPLPWPSPP